MAQKHTLDYKEYPMTRDGRIQGPSRRYRRLRHPSFAADLWAAKNPLLQRGEIGVEIDTNKLKAGDGITYWNDLPYVTSVGQPVSTANYQMGNSSGGWTTMSQAQQDALNSGATSAKISAIDGKLNLDGTNTMTGVLKMRASISFECAIAPYWHGVGLYQLNDDDSVTLLASMETPDGWCPGTNDTFNMGSTSKKWKNLYLSGTAYIGAINNGFNITVPVTNSADEFALKSQVDLKANSADLGTAAYTASTDYATAAQGALADTAVQPGDLATVATTGEFSDLQNKPTTLSGYGITDGANTDLSNLTSTGANIGNWSHNVTNCITEIPQDIKLELNNGTLTLKAGSKVYVPNGVGVFDTVTIASDVTYTYAYGAYTLGLYYNPTGGYLEAYTKNAEVSGTTPANTCTFYNISTNNISRINNGTVATPKLSFPIATITTNASQITSIDQVFNGFGYIGSTVFALPGIKWLAADGRNADGTLKSIEHTNTSVLHTDYPYNDNIVLYMDENLLATLGYYVQSETEPTTAYTVWYKPSENILRSRGAGGWVVFNTIIVFANAQTNITGIKSFSPIQAFHALDYNDSEYIAHCAMPSDRYIDLTLGASGAQYTAPADGYFASYSSNVCNTIIRNSNYNIGSTVVGASGFVNFNTFPVKNGDVVVFVYSASIDIWRFYYAQGAA